MIVPVFSASHITPAVESALGVAMKAQAWKDGQRKALPVTRDTQEPPYTQKIRKLIEVDGLRHFEVARAVGISRSRVTQIAGQYRIKAK